MNGVHLACLSGDNGAGKSALLDSMTWALWGEARANSSDDLIAQGEIEMQADFEFLIGDQLYRVDRRRSKKGAGHTVLNFFIWGGTDWTKITQATVTATQKHITETLRMSYDTFINSAFLKQGKADEFTIKTASERKKVLAEILGLGYFDELEKKAKEKAKDADTNLRQLKNRLEEIDNELVRLPGYEAQKAEAALRLAECKERLLEHSQSLTELRGDEIRLREKETQQRKAATRLAEVQQELSGLAEEQLKVRRSLSESEKILSCRAEIEQGFADLQRLNQEVEALNDKSSRHLKLEKQKTVIEREVNKARATLDANIKATNDKLIEMRALAAGLDKLEPEFANLQKELVFSISASEDLEQKQTEAQTIQANITQANSDSARLKKEMNEIKEKADHIPHAGDVCDRCGTLLTEAAHEQTKEQYREEYKSRLKEYKDTQTRLEALQATLEETKRAVKALEKPARDRLALEKRAGGMEEKLTQARKAGTELVAQQGLLQSYTETLNNKEFALTEQRKLDEIQGELKALGYDEKAHDQVRAQQRTLKPFEEQKNRLRDAEKDRDWAEKDLTRLTEAEKKARAEEILSQEEVKRLQAETAGLEQLRVRIQAEELLVKDAEKLKARFADEFSRATAAIERCEMLEVKKKELHKEHSQTVEAKNIYTELAEAFGKKGMQALVIDTVLPELEEETNRLLGDMSDGRMSVRFDTQRDNKKGEVMETLDLRISDEQGSRPYELFSGGEAFRVNFAVRIALSKLLARRSGAQLRTLIIDEGFGSQDGPGRERLVEAIRGIEGDFERVLVITHLQELKDVFPVRIDVVKTATGSHLSVN